MRFAGLQERTRLAPGRLGRRTPRGTGSAGRRALEWAGAAAGEAFSQLRVRRSATRAERRQAPLRENPMVTNREDASVHAVASAVGAAPFTFAASGSRVDGMVVRAFDPHDVTIPKTGIVRHPHTVWTERYDVAFADGSVSSWSWDHRTVVDDRGWVRARDLRPGDVVSRADGTPRVVKLTKSIGEAPVVKFGVEGPHAYVHRSRGRRRRRPPRDSRREQAARRRARPARRVRDGRRPGRHRRLRRVLNAGAGDAGRAVRREGRHRDYVKANPTCVEADAEVAYRTAALAARPADRQWLLVDPGSLRQEYSANLVKLGLIPDTSWASWAAWIVATDRDTILGRN